MKRPAVIALTFLIIGVGAPWYALSMALMVAGFENEEPEFLYFLVVVIVTMLTFAIMFSVRQASRRVVLDAQTRRARDGSLPAVHMSLILATYAAIERGWEAHERLRATLGSVAPAPLSPETKDRLLALMDQVTRDLAAGRRELEDVSRDRSSRGRDLAINW